MHAIEITVARQVPYCPHSALSCPGAAGYSPL